MLASAHSSGLSAPMTEHSPVSLWPVNGAREYPQIMKEAQCQDSADNHCSAANLLAELTALSQGPLPGRGASDGGVQSDPVSCRAQDIGDHKLPANTSQGDLQLYKHQVQDGHGALPGGGLFRRL